MKNFTLLILIALFVGICNVSGQMPGQVALDPSEIPQFVDPLPHFAGLRVDATAGDLTITYEPIEQVAVSTGTVLSTGTVGSTPEVGLAKLWGYSISNGTVTTPAHWPAYTIEARHNSPLNVVFVNNLHGETYADLNMVVDQTLHWADPFDEMDHGNMSPYTGPVPVSPHLHGGEVPSESDGGPESWFTPGYEHKGPSWGFDGVDQFYHYSNTQEPSTLWIHDHALGITRLNVYAGLAGFYFLRGPDEEAAKLPGWSGDDLVQEVAPEGTSGVFNQEPYLPEIEIVIQDRMFDTEGELFYPNEAPNPMVHPFWSPEFIGDIITVNGKTWPYLSVAPRKYRIHLLNGSNARFYEMDLQGDGKKPAIIQVGTDGGLLDRPVNVTGEGGRLLLAPGERADLVIDFSESREGQVLTLVNSARSPFPMGTPVDPNTTGRIMQFVVNGLMVSAEDNIQPGIDKSVVPTTLRSQPVVRLTDFEGSLNVTPDVKRQLTLNEVMGMGGPMEVLLNNTDYVADPTEIPTEGTTETWEIINLTADAHPIHLHLVQFQLVSRQAFNLSNYEKVYEDSFEDPTSGESGPPMDYNELNQDGALGGNPAVSPYLQGKPSPPEDNEHGWKDTYVVYPGEVTTFVIRYAPTSLPLNAPASALLFEFDPSEGPGYVWHCHILDHEDNEMMRPYTLMPSPSREDVVTGVDSYDNDGFNLGQNYPNPATDMTEISFNIPEPTHVRLTLYNQLGQELDVLIDNEAPAGNNKVVLDRRGLVKGVYFYKLQAGDNEATKKMVLQ